MLRRRLLIKLFFKELYLSREIRDFDSVVILRSESRHGVCANVYFINLNTGPGINVC